MAERKKYKVIYADPPWQYRVDSRQGCAKNHYASMKLEEIKALPIADLGDTDCALFLWVTIPFIQEGLEVLKAWGFTYKTTAFVWVKQNRKADSLFLGMGYWTRSNVEICFLGIKGRPKRADAGVRQIIMSHVEEHSKKPQEAYNRIIRLMGDVPRIELFARRKTKGFDAWGNEVESDIELEGGK